MKIFIIVVALLGAASAATTRQVALDSMRLSLPFGLSPTPVATSSSGLTATGINTAINAGLNQGLPLPTSLIPTQLNGLLPGQLTTLTQGPFGTWIPVPGGPVVSAALNFAYNTGMPIPYSSIPSLISAAGSTTSAIQGLNAAAVTGATGLAAGASSAITGMLSTAASLSANQQAALNLLGAPVTGGASTTVQAGAGTNGAA